MPKMKTHKGAAKRFKVTAGGKLMRGKAFSSHILTKKSPKRIRGFRQEAPVSQADTKMVNRKLGRA